MIINAVDIINYLENNGHKVRVHLMKDGGHKCVLAGGAVANAILSIEDMTQYPINDLDYFVVATSRYRRVEEKDNRQLTEKWLGQYVDFKNNFMKIEDREETDDSDLIYMSCSVTQLPTEFPTNVLKSFDLNCVGVGIFYNQVTQDFELITTPEFDNFLERGIVEIVNVHSMVTFARLLKKADDLGAMVNLELESKIIQNVRSVGYMSPMSSKQKLKHVKYITELSVLFDGIHNLELRDIELYEGFYASKIQNIRTIKIKILRYYYTTNLREQSVLRYIILNCKNLLTYLATWEDSYQWFLSSGIEFKELDNLNDFMTTNGELFPIFRDSPLQLMVELCHELQSYDKIVIENIYKVLDGWTDSDWCPPYRIIQDAKNYKEAVAQPDELFY